MAGAPDMNTIIRSGAAIASRNEVGDNLLRDLETTSWKPYETRVWHGRETKW